MKALLGYVVRGRMQATVVAAAALMLPLTSFISAGLAGLVTLRHGMLEGGFVLALSMAIAAALNLFVFHSMESVLSFGVVMGLPVWLLATVLRFTTSQGVTLVAAGLLGALTICAIHLLSADPVAWWRGVLDRIVFEGVPENPPSNPEALTKINAILDSIAPWMRFFPVWAMVLAILIVFMARWWQALLDNPGGFGREFRELRLDRRVAFLTIGIALAALLFGQVAGGLSQVLFQLMVTLYVIQGIALVHSLVARKGASAGWLVAMYASLLVILPLAPLAAMSLAVAGFSDTWLNYRRRWSSGS